MQITEISKKIKSYKDRGLRLFVTSSFQTHSIPLLHLLSEIDKGIPIYCLDTGYQFPETHVFRDQIAVLLDMTVIRLQSSTPKSMQRDANGNLLFTSNPDHCCYLNKIQPLEPVLASHDIWINGIRADQNANRASLRDEESSLHGTTRFHPLLDWSARDVEAYVRKHDLPRHPLDALGYVSIGCEPCTRKINPEAYSDPRLARWFGLNKTECGLHTELVQK